MIKNLTLVICCCAFGFVSIGQTTSDENSQTDSIENRGSLDKKWQLGLNAATLWMNVGNYTPSIMTQGRVWQNVHLRAQVGFESNNNDGQRDVVVTNAFFSNGTIDSTIKHIPGVSKNTFISVGLSNYTPLMGNFDLYYGGDYMYNINNSEWTEDQVINQVFQQGNATHFHNTNEYDIEEQTQGISLFGGLRFRANKRLSLGIETSFQFTLIDITEKRVTKNIQWNEFNPQVFEQSNTSKGSWREINYGFRPVSGLYVLVHL